MTSLIMDTAIIQTHSMAPLVSVLTGFDCVYKSLQKN